VEVEVSTVEGDQRMSEESVEVERSVGRVSSVVGGRQARLVTPASCPIRRASKVILYRTRLNKERSDVRALCYIL
jgi:hypothetical protein